MVKAECISNDSLDLNKENFDTQFLCRQKLSVESAEVDTWVVFLSSIEVVSVAGSESIPCLLLFATLSNLLEI